MEKEYGIEYEREVLAAFDRMKKKYESNDGEETVNAESEAVQTPAAPEAGAYTAEPAAAEAGADAAAAEETRVFSKSEKEAIAAADIAAAASVSAEEIQPARGPEAETASEDEIATLESIFAEPELHFSYRVTEPNEESPKPAEEPKEEEASISGGLSALLGMAAFKKPGKKSSEEKAEDEKPAESETPAEVPSQEVPAAAAAAEAATGASAFAAATAETKPESSVLKRKKSGEKKAQKSEKQNAAEEGTMKKKKKKNKNWGLKILYWSFLLVLVACLGAGCFVGYKVLGIIKDTPEINPDNIYTLLGENSVLLDGNGNFLENIYSGSALRSNIEYKDLPENLKNAFVCIEDKTFWDHHGFNFIRIVGAVVEKLTGASERVGGTSTITQQLARNLYLADVKGDRDMTRKIREAYYTVVIESSLTKEQILEAYLNTIYLGYNSNGVAAAAEAYFSKDVKDLDLLECAALAALPQSPNNYAPIKRVSVNAVQDPEKLDIISKDDSWIVYYNDTAKDRIKLVLYYMHDQGKIDDATYETAKADTIRNYINPGTNATTYSKYSYFVDYVKDSVLDDLQTKLGYTYDEASKLLYTGGLTIHSTLDTQIQDIVEEVYANPDNFPDVGTLRKDKAGNILYQEGEKILLYSKANMFDEEGYFTLKKDEFEWMANGDLKIFKGNRLNIYNTSVGGTTDYSIEFKGFYEIEDKKFYSCSGGVWSIGQSYKTRNAEGDVIISAQYFKDKPDTFRKNEDGTLSIGEGSYTLAQRVLQPQSAMTILDYTNSHLVAMIGGRGIEGKLLFNRATSTRQPGSSIKPLAVYSTALQAGVDGLGNFTAAMPLDDMPIKRGNTLWPKNWYSGYTGMTNLRHAVEQSINACAVQLFLQLDPQLCLDQLEGMGITSLVKTGDVNDVNASALALGGMTRGISPLEMTGAYGTFGNYGVYTEPLCYTKITNKRGDVIIDRTPVTHKVMDESTASLMTDILRTTVTNGLASAAKMSSSETAGKTGTTSEKYDIWFCGLTPQYSAAVWIGNDVNISLKQGSTTAVKLWKMVMDPVCALSEPKKFEMKGEFVRLTVDRYSGKLLGENSSLDSRGTGLSEIFIKGTEPGEVDDSHVVVNVCAETGYLATPYCTNVIQKVGIVRPGGKSWEKLLAEYGAGRSVSMIPDAKYDAPEYYCPIHNPNTASYPVSPLGTTTAQYNPNDVIPEPVEVFYYDRSGVQVFPVFDEAGAPMYTEQLYDSYGTPITTIIVDELPAEEGPSEGDPLDPQQPSEGDPAVPPVDPGSVTPQEPGQPVTPENPQQPPAEPQTPPEDPAPENPGESSQPVEYEPVDEPEAPSGEIDENDSSYVDENGEIIYNW